MKTNKKTLLELWQYRKDEFCSRLKREGFIAKTMLIDNKLVTAWSKKW